MNPISENITKGTFGEILTQLKLLQFGVQAAPPIKDSGNDLIAIRGEVFKALQVKTRTRLADIGELPKLFHILAIVILDPDAEGTNISIDRCRIFLVSKDEFEASGVENIEKFEINEGRINELFPVPNIKEQFAAA